jgi:Novel STAND NTPase 1
MTATTATRDSPYVGLVPFEAGDQELFFGREDDIELIIANLYAFPLTLLYGPTGVGKTSVIQAGVVPRLAGEVHPLLFSSWQGREAERKLWTAVRALDEKAVAGAKTLAEALLSVARVHRTNVMLVLDQFEEYFLYHPQGHALDEQLATVMTLSGVPVSVLISMREDGLALLDRFEDRVPGLFDNYLRFDHLTRDGATDAIELPLQTVSPPVRPSRRLTDAVLAEVGEARRARLAPHQRQAAGERYEAPYLQIVMDRLWRARPPDAKSLKPGALKELGGIAGVLRTQVDEAMAAMAPQEQSDAALLFRYLVTPSGAKVAYTAEDLAEYTGLPRRDITSVLQALAKRHRWLIRVIAAPDGEPADARYELVHDLLAGPVSDWRTDYLAGRQVVQQGTTFASLVRAYEDREEEKRERGTVSSVTEARFQAQVSGFEKRFGPLVQVHWPERGYAVALTRGASKRLHLHHELARLEHQPSWMPLLERVSTVAARSADSLSRRDADRTVGELYDLLVGAVGRVEDGMSPVAAVESIESLVGKAESEFGAACERTGRFAYQLGVTVAFGVVAALVFAYQQSTLRVDSEVVFIGASCGAFGGVAGVFQRVLLHPELFGTGLSRRTYFNLGALRIALAAGFGVLVAFVLDSTTSFDVIDQYPIFIVACAIAGVCERFVPDLLRAQVSSGVALRDD